jgi:malonyl-CoA O-methyltransferase
MTMTEQQVNKKILSLHFSKSAAEYHRLALLQREIAWQLVEWAFPERVHPAGPAPEVLEIGCGTGFLTEFLLGRLPGGARLTALDLAEGMLARVRPSLEEQGLSARLLRADGEALPFRPGSFDLAASSTTFQWFGSLGQALEGIHRVLRPGGRLIFATLGRDTYRELREAYRSAAGRLGIRLAASRYGIPLPGAQELSDLLGQAGFVRVEVYRQDKLEFFPTCRDFLRSIKERGGNNPNFRPMSLAVERALLREMTAYYDRSFHVDGRVYAGYEVLFARAERG